MRVSSLLALVVVAVAGCGQPTTGERGPGPGGPPPAPTADAAPVGRTDCVDDAAAERACQARGSGFEYGPQPYIYCSGVAPRPEDEQRAWEAIRTSPCVCNDVEAVERQREECSRVPSRPVR